MLYEIYCDHFCIGGKDGEIRPPIRFHAGLNTVLGTQTRSNSIGKSTFLLIIDYVFGGDDYLKNDARTFVGEHEIFFTFRFGDTLHRFCRNTRENDIVYICESCSWEEEQARLERIRLNKENALSTPSQFDFDRKPYVFTGRSLKVDEFCKFLFNKYEIESENISFRNIVGRYFRVYGRQNHDEYKPLHSTPKEKDSDAITALQRLFGETQQIKDLKAYEKEKTEEKKAYQAAQKYHLVHHITTKKALKEAIQKLDQLKSELSDLLLTKDHETENVNLIRSDVAVSINRKLARLRRNRNRLKSQLEALYINIDGGTYVTQGDISDLAHFFPEVNISELQDIEDFHRRLRSILKAEMMEEERELLSSIETLDEEIKILQDQLRSIGIPASLPASFLSKHAALTMQISELEEQINSFQQNENVKSEQKKAVNMLKAAQEKELPRIAGEINAQMVRISDQILGPEREAPRLDLKDGKSYTFGTSTNRGTGNNYKNLIIYDLSVLAKTDLPAIIHDSFILTDIGDAPTNAIVKQYIKTSSMHKQVFIALDKTQSYGKETDKALNDHQVLNLSENGNELFGWSWDHKTTES